MYSMRSLPSELLNNPLFWRAGDKPTLTTAGIASGFAELDQQLPDRGWPRSALTELLCDAVGIGEVSLLLPAMSSANVRGKGVIWIAPPYLPYAPALAAASVDLQKLLILRPTTSADALWAAEQAIRAGAAAMVVTWLSQHIEYAMLRRLQLACSTAECAGFIYRTSNALRQASPAPLRLALTRSCDALTRSSTTLTQSCDALTPSSSTGLMRSVSENAVQRDSLRLQIVKRRGMSAAQPLWVATAGCRVNAPLSSMKQAWFAMHETGVSLRA